MLSSLTGILDSSPEMLALFVGFGLVVGLLFGFFGMGGSFLVTPALLMLGYPATVAVGSGMAFVFGTAVIATLKHHDLGQVDYKLGAIMIAGTTVGIEVGRASVFYLEELGLADGIISVVYVFLLGGIGLMITRESLASDGGGGIDHDAAAAEDLSEYEIPDIAKKIQQTVRIPPMVTLRGDIRVSVWVITAVAFSTGILSGFLGVGGGFIRMPAMIYAIGVPRRSPSEPTSSRSCSPAGSGATCTGRAAAWISVSSSRFCSGAHSVPASARRRPPSSMPTTSRCISAACCSPAPSRSASAKSGRTSETRPWRRWDSFSLSALRSSWPRRSSSPRFGRSGRLVITCPLRPTNSRSPAAGQLRRRATAPTDRTR